jgi:hypothetical protein
MIISYRGRDEEFVKKMIALFIETVPENLAEMILRADENWDMISKTAPYAQIQPLIRMGIHSLSQVVRTVESTSKRRSP